MWLWTSAVVFVVLGFIDPDGRGSNKGDLPRLFFALDDLLQPSRWLGYAYSADPFPLAGLTMELSLVGFFLVAIALASAFLGWLLQFLITPLMPIRAQRGVDI